MVIGYIETQFGLGRFLATKYQEGGDTAVVLEGEKGETISILSTNIPGLRLKPNEFLAKTWSENEEIAALALDSKLFKDTGRRVPTGFVEAQIWSIEEPVPMQCYDACMVQDACNPSGVLHSFIRLWEMEQWSPSNPIAIMYASKICSMGGQFEDFLARQMLWDDVLKLAKRCVGEMGTLDTGAKSQLDSYKLLCNMLSAWTLCHNHNVANDTFVRVVKLADWTGKESQRERFVNTYCNNLQYA